MKFSMIILFFCFITFSFDLVQSENLQISQFGGKQNTNIAKVWTFHIVPKKDLALFDGNQITFHPKL